MTNAARIAVAVFIWMYYYTLISWAYHSKVNILSSLRSQFYRSPGSLLHPTRQRLPTVHISYQPLPDEHRTYNNELSSSVGDEATLKTLLSGIILAFSREKPQEALSALSDRLGWLFSRDIPKQVKYMHVIQYHSRPWHYWPASGPLGPDAAVPCL